jgi:murein DD-endopeptidase MepM/ murein hydrolase activator NlpD
VPGVDFVLWEGYYKRYLMTELQEVSVKKCPGGSSPLLYVAFGAIFLFLMLGFKTTEGLNPNNFLTSPVFLQGAGELNSKMVAVPETPELMLVARTGILAATPPLAVTPRVLGAIVGQLDTDLKPEVTRYLVEEGDTLTSLAEKFGVSVETIAWANDLKVSSGVKPGQELIILPVSGALHLVRPNDTLSEIASWYQGNAQDIVDFNGLASSQSLFAGDILIIPNGKMPKVLPQGRLTPLANSFFIYPIGGNHRITQGLHAFNAVDFSNAVCGESVYAAAGGTVQRTGYTNVGGNYVRVLHPNGVVTYYGHFSSILTNPGAKVLQGQLIGYSGHTGYTIPRGPAGCHLHFEVRGAANPFAR